MRSIRVKGVPVLLHDTQTSRNLKDAVFCIFKVIGFICGECLLDVRYQILKQRNNLFC